MVYGFGLCWVNHINKVSIQSLHPEFISAHSLLICLPFTATWVEHSGEHSFTHSEAATCHLLKKMIENATAQSEVQKWETWIFMLLQ
jgi:hypothetical protein